MKSCLFETICMKLNIQNNVNAQKFSIKNHFTSIIASDYEKYIN